MSFSSYDSSSYSSSFPSSTNLVDYSPTEKAILEIFNLVVQGEVEIIKERTLEGDYIVKEIFYLSDGSVLIHISIYVSLFPSLPSLSWVMFVNEDSDSTHLLAADTLEEIERELEKMCD